MPVKIRLARHGRKRNAFYHIVAADGRAPRDGKYIERIGSYNPNTNPATIDLNFDKALEWLMKGAQPTDTARAILSYEGVMYKKHLLGGVAKGAFDEAAAEAKYTAWKNDKLAKINANKEGIAKVKDDDLKSRLDAETKINELRMQAIAKQNSDLVAAAEAEAKEKEEAKIAAQTPVVEEKVAVEAPVVEAEAPKEEVAKETAKVEEKVAKETPKAEEKVVEEAPKAEKKVAKETPKAETEEKPKA